MKSRLALLLLAAGAVLALTHPDAVKNFIWPGSGNSSGPQAQTQTPSFPNPLPLPKHKPQAQTPSLPDPLPLPKHKPLPPELTNRPRHKPEFVEVVSIYNSPAMPDVAGHGVIEGLLTGRGLTAILPNLFVCTGPKNLGPHGLACTPTCRPGHKCMNAQFQPRVQRDPDNPDFIVRVFDNDRAGHVREIVSFTKDPNTCTPERHCTMPISDTATYGQGAVVELAFGYDTGKCVADRLSDARTNAVTFINGKKIATQYDQVKITAPVTIVGNGGSSKIPNGIKITVKDPNAKFIQYFYREVIANGQPVKGYINCPQNQMQVVNGSMMASGCVDSSHPGVLSSCENKSDPSDPWTCEPLTENPRLPAWNSDAYPPNPYYTERDLVHNDCDQSVSLFDTPNFSPDSTGATWRFTANDFVMINGSVAYRITWVLTRKGNSIQYSNIQVEPADAAIQAILQQFLNAKHQKL